MALQAIGAGQWPEALEPLSRLAELDSPDYHPMVALLSAGDLIETAHRTARPDIGAETLRRLEEFVRQTRSPWAGAIAARSRALLADEPQTVQHFTDALELHRDSNRRFEQARTRLLFGEHLRRARRRQDARIELRQAIDELERLGAEPWAARARGELRATGETARKRDPSTLTELTPQQLQIVQLVANGASNKDVARQLFLSPRTVDYHLRNVFAKMGITSRAELAHAFNLVGS
jgi:DNA-binding CsgD family transcriptional regulator